MDNGIATQKVNQKAALLLAYDYLRSTADTATTEPPNVFVYSIHGDKITLKDSLEAIKKCACAI